MKFLRLSTCLRHFPGFQFFRTTIPDWVNINYVMTLLQLVYSRWRWQASSLGRFTDAYRQDNAKRIVGIWSDNILFRDVIQPQTNREKYGIAIFKQAEKEDHAKCTI